MLEFNHVAVALGKQVLSRDLCMQLAPGKLHVIIGPNGTGKTSLLRALFGELPLQAGTIRFNGRTLADLGPTGGDNSLAICHKITSWSSS